MNYEVIEKNKYGVLVRKIKSIPTECEKCKYTGLAVTLQPCKSCKADNSYYLHDSEAEKLESEQIIIQDFFKVKSKKDQELLKEMQTMINNPDNSLADAYTKKVESEMQVFYDSQKELIDLQIENKQLKERVNELEQTIENNVTELITEMDGVCGVVLYEITKTKCCGVAPITNENFCPNCGRKIVR